MVAKRTPPIYEGDKLVLGAGFTYREAKAK
jgi:hypothetical protein